MTSIPGRPTGWVLGGRSVRIGGKSYVVWYGPSGELTVRELFGAEDLVTVGKACSSAAYLSGCWSDGTYIYALQRNDSLPLYFDVVRVAPATGVVTPLTAGAISIETGYPRKVRMVCDAEGNARLLSVGLGAATTPLTVKSVVLATGVVSAVYSGTYGDHLVDVDRFQSEEGTVRARLTNSVGTQVYVRWAGGLQYSDNGYECYGDGYHTHGGTVLYNTGDAASWDLGLVAEMLFVLGEGASPKFFTVGATGSYFEGATLKGTGSAPMLEYERSNALEDPQAPFLSWASDSETFYVVASRGGDVQ